MILQHNTRLPSHSDNINIPGHVTDGFSVCNSGGSSHTLSFNTMECKQYYLKCAHSQSTFITCCYNTTTVGVWLRETKVDAISLCEVAVLSVPLM